MGDPSLRPSDRIGVGYLLLGVLTTSAGISLALSDQILLWLTGQIFITIAFIQWFSMLHECGHGTLFRRRLPNQIVGQLAGFFALIPFISWKRVHALHHRWTGWQDIDPTTEQLAHKPTNLTLLALANFCWRWWIPLFSVVYRLENYWNLPRLRKQLQTPAAWRGLALNALLLITMNLAILLWFGPWVVLKVAGVGLLAALIFQDVFLLSQHTHVPQKQSGGREVTPFPPAKQEIFTRSLKFPAWFSRLVLIESDAHELHHMYPYLPGYRLHRIPEPEAKEMHWLKWTLAVRRIPAEVFLYQNRNETGFDI
jgi:acyl-lipid omega-6 desaturase (Delta-12 desaturase)